MCCACLIMFVPDFRSFHICSYLFVNLLLILNPLRLTSLVLMQALNWDLSCLRCNFFDFVMQAKQAMQASLGIKVLGYSSFVQDCASLALLFSINAFAIESARTRDRLVMACPYAKSLHDEFPLSLAQDMSLLDNWPLLISFEHRAKRNKYT